MAEAVETMDGWYCLHDFRVMDWTSWKLASVDERQAAIEEFQNWLSNMEQVEEANKGSQLAYKIIGHKADVMFMIMRPTMDELQEIETTFDKTKLASYMTKSFSYLSVVELSKYMSKPGVDIEQKPEVQARLKPILPRWDYMCFYPMDKRRMNEDNWYSLEKDARSKLMYEHSKTGRKYAGQIKQIITGSFGFDDWEWGVTLFAHDPLPIKKLVYEMRFDEVSARYGEFGDFYFGNILTIEAASDYFHI
ncbi:chlorite dismutase [Terribacillus halophilus]|uniref:Coproheme decarboxylase n=1 Tax=Terribacillus halophilus TaxID=361279 RepID=A0A1G6I8W5_9BACI|nr:hydrogen peroxide-dependent heme synthase [Terribacillus halophilus]SDC02465.1 chlorite dismutase [Terribacillus halophilus]